jgi:hypothetical protein
VDVLEFILNVRDINRDIPVVVIGPARNERIDREIMRQDYTIILKGHEVGDKLAKKLAQAHKENKSENV